MFDQFNGLPLHVLVLHAAVVTTPLAVALAVLYALAARLRWLLRWPLVVSALAALGSVLVAVQSGEVFEQRLGLPQEVTQAHEAAGRLLQNLMFVFTALALVAAFALGGPSALRSGRGGRTGLPRLLQTVVAVVLIVAALGVGWQVYRTGDSGARAVWGSAGGS